MRFSLCSLCFRAMVKEFDTWIHLQHSPWLFANSNQASDSLNHKRENASAYRSHIMQKGCYVNKDSPGLLVSGFSQTGLIPPVRSHCFGHSYASAMDVGRFSIPTHGCGQTVINSAEKRFLVFDQSGDKTSLIFSSVSPLIPFGSLSLHNLKPREQISSRIFEEFPALIDDDPIHKPNVVPPDLEGFDKGDGASVVNESEMHEDTEEIDALLYSDDEYDDLDEEVVNESEMHEDTEEIDALLYSDDEYDDLDEDVTSTGHSPSDMTGFECKRPAESMEEVASSSVPTKRRRLEKEEELDASLRDSASSLRTYFDEVEPSHGRGGNRGRQEDEASSNNHNNNKRSKNMKREKIQETVGVLRRLIPGGKGKDAALILDEAVQYLRSLKLKAKALGGTL
ncbi:Transcription factor SAC51 [Acorus gramineus]|uniref:Transcription factor SAC51 n=1 Tax=Acorus gramineus TaxID=55184 RepID=A0AAV9BR87_ACOGR|nr:Transcription factor SAC51 [Acorus gramineus]